MRSHHARVSSHRAHTSCFASPTRIIHLAASQYATERDRTTCRVNTPCCKAPGTTKTHGSQGSYDAVDSARFRSSVTFRSARYPGFRQIRSMLTRASATSQGAVIAR